MPTPPSPGRVGGPSPPRLTAAPDEAKAETGNRRVGPAKAGMLQGQAGAIHTERIEL